MSVIAHQRRAAEKGFDAAVMAAETARTGIFFARQPRQRRMSPFAGDVIASGDDLAIDHNAAADACAENNAKDHTRAGAGAVDRL